MGLDQYARATRQHPNTPVDFERDNDALELHYWRKHPNLHGWMEKLYRRKGGAEKEFNVTPVVLTLEDLDALERAILRADLPPTAGFFFGVSEGDPDEVRRDLDFVHKARAAIADGMTVYYTSWW